MAVSVRAMTLPSFDKAMIYRQAGQSSSKFYRNPPEQKAIKILKETDLLGGGIHIIKYNYE